MKISIAYTDTCLPDYFRGDSRPWVALYPSESGYTSRELREYILSEFRLGAIGGNDPVCYDYIGSEAEQKRADKFYSKLPAALNREIKFRGKRHKFKDYDLTPDEFGDIDYAPLLHIVFNIDD